MLAAAFRLRASSLPQGGPLRSSRLTSYSPSCASSGADTRDQHAISPTAWIAQLRVAARPGTRCAGHTLISEPATSGRHIGLDAVDALDRDDQDGSSSTSSGTRPAAKSGSARQGGKRQARTRAKKKQRPAIGLKRSDLTYRDPPWLLQYDVSAADLRLGQLGEAVDDQECEATPVTVMLNVDRVGAGFYAHGNVGAQLPMLCDCCGASYVYPIKAGFQVWLNADPEECRSAEVAENPDIVPFPAHKREADLSEVVTDAVCVALPSINLCGGPDCLTGARSDVGVSGADAGWSTDGAATEAAAEAPEADQPVRRPSGTRQFAALQQLRPQLPLHADASRPE